MQIPILSDVTRTLSRDYGVLLEDSGHTLRGLFIISPTGVIRHATLNDPPVGRNVDEILRLVQAYQFAHSTLHSPATKRISTSLTVNSHLPLFLVVFTLQVYGRAR